MGVCIHINVVHIIWCASVKRLMLSLLAVEIHPASFAVHADPDAMFLEYVGEGRAGELAALVGVEDAGCAMPGQRFVERRDAEVRVEGVGQPPGEYLAAVPVHDGHEVDEAPGHRKIRHIGAPDLIGAFDGETAQETSAACASSCSFHCFTWSKRCASSASVPSSRSADSATFALKPGA